MGALKERLGRWMVRVGLGLLGALPKGANVVGANVVVDKDGSEEENEEDDDRQVLVAPLTQEAASMLVIDRTDAPPLPIPEPVPVGSLQDRMLRARREMGDR